jgi:hypothetical protein
MSLLPRGRVLRATFGCNPNSSSLGVDVTFLLFGATFASALALALGALLRSGKSAPGAGATPIDSKAATPSAPSGEAVR